MTEQKHDPMDEEYWKKQIEKTLKLHTKDKLITEDQRQKLLKHLKKI